VCIDQENGSNCKFEGVHRDKVHSWASRDTAKTTKWTNFTVKENGCCLAHFDLIGRWFPQISQLWGGRIIMCLMFLSPFKWQREKEEELKIMPDLIHILPE